MTQAAFNFRWTVKRRAGSFGGRACRSLRARLLRDGVAALPRSWQRPWMMQRILATPPWADMVAIREVYDAAAQLTVRTGTEYVVDHIIPLIHPRVCGLHIAINLQPITAKANGAKSNRWCPEQGELF